MPELHQLLLNDTQSSFGTLLPASSLRPNLSTANLEKNILDLISDNVVLSS